MYSSDCSAVPSTMSKTTSPFTYRRRHAGRRAGAFDRTAQRPRKARPSLPCRVKVSAREFAHATQALRRRASIDRSIEWVGLAWLGTDDSTLVGDARSHCAAHRVADEDERRRLHTAVQCQGSTRVTDTAYIIRRWPTTHNRRTPIPLTGTRRRTCLVTATAHLMADSTSNCDGKARPSSEHFALILSNIQQTYLGTIRIERTQSALCLSSCRAEQTVAAAISRRAAPARSSARLQRGRQLPAYRAINSPP